MQDSKKNNIVKRPPVIVVMGHIDHGKSTLLDYIRKSNTVAREAGGITQHIGAYETVYTDKAGNKHTLTFIDTPGHEAFTAMRARGAKVADIAILVVSAEDGVKPQTLDALKAIKASKTPFMVAINKIDRPGADVERTKGNLAEHEIYVEGFGGDIPWNAISALKGDGVSELLETVVLMAELQELKSDNVKPAAGFIIEAHVDSKKGTVATLVIKEGTLGSREVVVSQNAFCSARALEDYSGKKITTASASSPVRITGWNTLPSVGAPFVTVATRAEAVALAEKFSLQKQNIQASSASLEANTVIVPIIVKADTAGSLEAIKHELKKISNETVTIKALFEGVGTIGEGDVKIASASNTPALIVGFNVRVDASAKAMADRLKISISTFDIIYRLAEWLAEECAKRKPRLEVEEETGRAKILKIFSSEKDKYVIGGKVESGKIQSGGTIKIIRRDSEIGRGKIKGLQQQKIKADEVGTGKEFGAMIEASIEPAPGDRIEVFITVIK